MSLRDKLEVGLKPDAPYRPDNLPDHQQADPSCREGGVAGESADAQAAREACDTPDAGTRSAQQREDQMNRDQIEGKWKELKGEVKRQWGKLTDDDMAQLDGTKDKLVGVVQQRYGYEREQASRDVDEFWNRHAKTPTM